MVSGANIMSATKISAFAAEARVSNLSQCLRFFIADDHALTMPESPIRSTLSTATLASSPSASGSTPCGTGTL
jgi:hypothetical protein